jgi:hypothetical protein
MRQKSYIKIIFMSVMLVTLSVKTQADTVSPTHIEISYCEEISDKLDQYDSKEALFAALNLNVHQVAVQQLLHTEIAHFTSQVLEPEDFIAALHPLIHYERAELRSNGLLNPCLVLINPKVDDVQRTLFQPIEIGKLCSFDSDLLQKHSEEMKEAFIQRLFGKKNDIPPSLAPLLLETDKIHKKLNKDLIKLVHAQDVSPLPEALEQSRCLSLQIYPIELYALSAPYRSQADNIPSPTPDAVPVTEDKP